MNDIKYRESVKLEDFTGLSEQGALSSLSINFLLTDVYRRAPRAENIWYFFDYTIATIS